MFLRHFCTVDYMYQFPNKYAGKDSLNILRRYLLLAAKHCGYELVTNSNQISKVAAGILFLVRTFLVMVGFFVNTYLSY